MASSSAAAVNLDDVPSLDLMTELLRRMKCAPKPDKRLILIGILFSSLFLPIHHLHPGSFFFQIRNSHLYVCESFMIFLLGVLLLPLLGFRLGISRGTSLFACVCVCSVAITSWTRNKLGEDYTRKQR